MKKIVKEFCILALLLSVALSGYAYSFSVDGVYYSENSDGKTVYVTYKTTSYNSYSGSVVIPSTVTYSGTTYSVTSIGSYAFRGCSGLTSVTIPNSVTSIGMEAFEYCSGLTSVNIPNSVTSIGWDAFNSCSSLKTVVFGSGLKEIGSNAFYNCSLAKTFWLPNTPPSGTSNVKSSVYYVANDQYSFSNQIKYQFLSSMFAVDGTVYVPVSPSERTCDVINCTYSPEDKSIVIKNKVINKGVELSVLKINPYSHKGNPFIENLSISNNGSIGDYAFQNCDALKSAIVENCGSIGDCAFQNCDVLESAIVKNCGTIGDYAFQNCDALKSATVENNGLIGNYAFSGCTSMKTVTLGSSVTGIGDKAFYNCSSLDKIIIPDAVTTVGTSAFEGCVSLENASIGKDVLSLPQSVFSGCRSLSSLTIPNNVKSIGNYAFSGCTSLSDITIEDGEKKDSTGQQTPVWFADWTSTNHNSSSTSYQEYSFEARGGNSLSFDYSVSSESGCDYLIIKLNETQIVKESGNKSGSYNKEFTEAGTYTLYLSYTKDSSTSSGSDQASVTNICVSNDVPFPSLSLGSNGSSPLFNDCPLDEVYIGRKLSYTTNSSAGYSPFYRNTSLRRVRITDAETQIYDNEFYGCSNLQALTIGNGVTTIGKWAFSGCSAMKDFSVGSKVESIGQEAFSDCTGLTSFYSCSIVPPTCGNQALDDINKWECSLYVPDDCISAYQVADQWKEFFFIYSGEEEISIEDKSAPNIVSGVLRCDGVFTDVYTLSGVKVYSGNGEVKLEGGVYIVVANGHATKVMVK